MIIFGPVPSRRLGQSVGINNIPPKTCSYSCVYCQIGRTDKMQIKRSEFYKPEEILRQTKVKMAELNRGKEHVDYLTFVPDGEPTLDKNLGVEIDLLKQFGIKIAVITNASLLWMDDVRNDLMKADWVSVKVDAVQDNIWRKIDRPQGSLNISKIMQGTINFAKEFKGTLVTETMLVDGINDNKECLHEIAKHIIHLKPSKSYLLVPTRPPAEAVVRKPSEESIRDAYDIIHNESGVEVECITGDEGDSFYFTDKVTDDLFSITSVHPIREDVINKILEDRHLDRSVIDNLIEKELIKMYIYEDKKFYRRNI